MKRKLLKQGFSVLLVCSVTLAVCVNVEAETTEEKLAKLGSDVGNLEYLIVTTTDMLAFLSLKFEALVEVLEHKGVLTKQELNAKIEEITKRARDKAAGTK